MNKKIVILILIIFLIPSIKAEKEVFIADSWQSYIKNSFCVDKGIPIVYKGGETGRFIDIYGGHPINKVDIESEYAIVSEEVISWALIASEFSSYYKAPIYFHNELEKIKEEKIIVLGNVDIDEAYLKFTETQEAQKYYLSLLDPDFLIITNPEDTYSFISSELLAKHKGFLIFSKMEDYKEIMKTKEIIKEISPDYVVWVTDPHKVTPEKVKKLYEICNIDEDPFYDIPVGIVTGLDESDATLLLAREHFYEKMEGDWKKRFLILYSMPEYQQSFEYLQKTNKKGVLSPQTIEKDRVFEAVQSSTFVLLYSHGCPSGFSIAGEAIYYDDIPYLHPMVFMTPACSTGVLEDERLEAIPEKSIALSMIRKGCSAYVGSIGGGGICLPALCSLGESVRVYNVLLNESDIAMILYGDPSFKIFDNFFMIDKEIGKNEMILEVKDVSGIQHPKILSMDISFEVNYVLRVYDNSKIYPFYPVVEKALIEPNNGKKKFITGIDRDTTFIFYKELPLKYKISYAFQSVLMSQNVVLFYLGDIHTLPWLIRLFVILFLIFLFSSEFRKKLNRKNLISISIPSISIVIYCLLLYILLCFIYPHGMPYRMCNFSLTMTILFAINLVLLSMISITLGSYFKHKKIDSALFFLFSSFLLIQISRFKVTVSISLISGLLILTFLFYIFLIVGDSLSNKISKVI